MFPRRSRDGTHMDSGENMQNSTKTVTWSRETSVASPCVYTVRKGIGWFYVEFYKFPNRIDEIQRKL